VIIFTVRVRLETISVPHVTGLPPELMQGRVTQEIYNPMIYWIIILVDIDTQLFELNGHSLCDPYILAGHSVDPFLWLQNTAQFSLVEYIIMVNM